ncbi:MAG: hypothetical protein RMX68_024615 [Aulosira sp. ZfuVER01]|nr:hypothetical protein [Aulosira sp. ZfuVER01]MDZ7997906.1 hypothetical protein [Aulosira sp. DedVER01a]MDZ8054703.1 hypothetical protein [Aulosira sp. ZfuCHP01]
MTPSCGVSLLAGYSHHSRHKNTISNLTTANHQSLLTRAIALIPLHEIPDNLLATDFATFDLLVKFFLGASLIHHLLGKILI